MSVVVQITLALCGAGLALAFARLVRGPSLADRVIALDVIAVQLVSVLVGASILTAEPSALWAAVVVALLAFLGTVAFARYMERSLRS